MGRMEEVSLTLDDSQEKVLREVYDEFKKRNQQPLCAAEFDVRRLCEAISPLMKPWRVDRHPHGAPYIIGPITNASVEVNGLGYVGSANLAERICRVLNGEERW